MTAELLKLANDAVSATRRADLLHSERLNVAIRAGCASADIHLVCSYPDCKCKQTPTIVKAALTSWENTPSPQSE